MRRFITAILFVLVVGAAWLGWRVYRGVLAPVTEQSVRLFVAPDAGPQDVRTMLDTAGLIRDAWVFDLLQQRMNPNRIVHPGHYIVEPGTSSLHLIRMLRGGWQTPVRVTFNALDRPQDLAGRVSDQLALDSADLAHALTDSARLAERGWSATTALAHILPNTYEVYWTVDATDFLDRMQAEFDAFWTEERLGRAADVGLRPLEVITLASIVEKEMRHTEEGPRIAGVYVNRLEIGMALQADPTLLFALGDTSIRRVLNVHKNVESPYNTYLHTGLPPGPICMPSTTTIDAVLGAEDHDFLYFCAHEDLSGYHRFAATYAQHLENARLYQRALNARGIYR